MPIEQVNLIQRYVGKEGRAPKLDRIGGQGVGLAQGEGAQVGGGAGRTPHPALRAPPSGCRARAFDSDTDWQEQFEAGFPYQETADQITCIEEVKADMEAPSPMDRLICGDVGFGKTEVALRAAFKAVMGGKQVAVLTPTTIPRGTALRDVPGAVPIVPGQDRDAVAVSQPARSSARWWRRSRPAASTW